MSTSPTVSQLIAAVLIALPKLAPNQARAFIKANNVRSLTKIETVSAEYKGMTKEELATQFGEASDEAFVEVKGSKAKVTKKAAGAKKVARQGREPRKTAAVVSEGPRGFRFGDVWNQSIKDGAGVAFMNANRNKLLKHAESLGITFDKKDESADIAKRIARKL